MKITFLVPPCFDHKQPAERSAGCTRVVYPMINIYELTLAAYLREKLECEVALKDFTFDKKGNDRFRKFLTDDNSDCYFIWTVNLSIDSDLHAISILREYKETTPVILTGPGATFYTRKCLVDNNIYVVRGEPEETSLELVRTIHEHGDLDNVAGISYLDKKSYINNVSRQLIQNLDTLPFPARDLLGDRKYHNPKLKTGPYTTMFTSRNCPFRCIYCVPSSLTFAREIEYGREHKGIKPPVGFRSISSIEAEIKLLSEQGYRAIGFMDDNFIWNEERTRAICDIMRHHGIVWGCQARVSAITEPIAKMLGESGCRYIDLGVESFDRDILEYIKKDITPEDIYRAVELLKKYNVPVKLNVLIGSSPLETKQTIKHTLHEVKKLNVDQVMFNIVSPFPGTKYHDICKENNWIKGDCYRPTDVQRESILDLPMISADEMEKLLFHNNISYFLSPRFIFKQISRFSSWSEFSSAIKALKIKLFS